MDRSRTEELLTPAERAAEWLSRFEEGEVGKADRWALLRWLRKSPENCNEVLFAKMTDLMLRQLQGQKVGIEALGEGHGNVVQIGECEPAARQANRARQRWAWAASIVLALAATSVALLKLTGIQGLLHPVYTTTIGEQRTVTLADGSVVAINADSSVRVELSSASRDVYLNEGQALFSVAQEKARPFRVHVGGSVVQAIGTKFDVRYRSDRTRVSVIEGAVRVTAPPSDRFGAGVAQNAERVAAGEAVSIEKTGRITPPAAIKIEEVGAWQQRLLVFSDATLGEIVDELARFGRTPHLRVDGEALRARRMSGTFSADSPKNLLVYLASDRTLLFEQAGDEVVIRSRPMQVQLSDGER